VHLIWIGLLALFIGGICTVVAYVLLGLIDFFTSVLYYQRLSFDPLHPASLDLTGGQHLGLVGHSHPGPWRTGDWLHGSLWL
jgi:hypothetical protein